MALLALLAAAAGASLSLPAAQEAIALRVAGEGRPHCTSYHADGSQGPCLPRFLLRARGGINSWTTGEQITFTRADTERLTSEEFALLAGHEIAHWTLRHQRSTPETELAADRLGARLACQAGFDPAAGLSLMRFYTEGDGHPPVAERRAVVAAVGCGVRGSVGVVVR